MLNKDNRKQIDIIKWRILYWSFVLIGVIAFSIFNSTFYIPVEYSRASMYGAIGGTAVGIGLGFMFSRVFKIKEIDN